MKVPLNFISCSLQKVTSFITFNVVKSLFSGSILVFMEVQNLSDVQGYHLTLMYLLDIPR